MTSLATTFLSVILLLAATVNFAHACPLSRHVRRNDAKASQLINAAIDSLGGHKALSNLQGVTYQSNDVFRVRTIMQNYHLFETDRYIISSGLQNVSFSFQDQGFSQRIDRSFVSSDLFIFITPELAPRNFSMVAESGSDGFVCFIKGSNNVFLPKNQSYGYADVVDEQLNITVIFDPETNLPLLIRALEDHPILGRTTNDLQLFNYTQVDGLLFPQTQKLIYGDEAILEETIVSQIYVNPQFEQGHFDGLALNETETTPSPPRADPKYGHAEVTEYWSNTLWAGAYTGSLKFLNVTHPADDLPGAHHLVFLNNTNFAQLILEFKESVIVFEAPPHQSELVIQWVKENLKKPISHLWVSHHHHDHNLDVARFVGIGASIIVPEMAASYWSKITGIKLVTFTEDKPYIYSDGKMQARFLWQADTPHSADWTYAIVTTACPDINTSMLAYTADAVSTNFESDSNLADSWLLQAMSDGLSKNTMVIPAHGWPISFSQVYKQLGSPYPDFNSTSFVTGGDICLDVAEVV
ncbi:hypothetical protein BKA66DRAFT_430002 [Pyrenochaeta sp. MPI-SDFR-AT-0127]|nr:hypothetical protein BKA66DRAFT_430002 [Pyrenochaeta sp. MPI-SDFR-AT-0127]